MEPWLRLDEAGASEARELLRTCCGGARWADAMVARRPFRDRQTLVAAARDVWFALDADDWLEAFRQHPRIGDRESLRRRFGRSGDLSGHEQRGVNGASEDVMAALAEGNRQYEAKFGFVFIVCATGRTADEMLVLLRERLRNDYDTELRNAAAEQARITELRLLGLH
jgi:2-oxo-4-hydroxy-4-carboxy-5-ureidoimidazoline decarboxylase